MGVYKSSTPTKDGRKWFFKIRYKDIDNKTQQYESKKYKLQREAEEAEAVFLLKVKSLSRKMFGTISQAYFEDMYKKRKESTVYCYENIFNKNIKPYFEQKEINSINLRDVNVWKEEMAKKGLKTNYLNKLFTVLNSIMKFAEKNYGLKRNYVDIAGCFETPHDEIIDDTKKIRYITHEEFNKFISVIDDTTDIALFNTFYYTGMRKGEIQALSWKDINFEESEINVNKTLSNKTKGRVYKLTSTKNNLNRKIKINKTLKEVLLQYKDYLKKLYKDFSEEWFVFGIHKPMAENTIKRHKDKYFDLAEVKRITLHEFRHSHVTLLINEYVKSSREKNIKIDTAKFFLMMSNRMGHTIEVMTKTYMHLFPTIQDEIVDLLDNL